MKIKIGFAIIAVVSIFVLISILVYKNNNIIQASVGQIHYKPLWETRKSDDKNYIFGNNIKHIYDNDGNLYVFDFNAKVINKYDTDGKYIAKYGRVGQGPGEFVIPRDFSIDKNGYIYAADIAKRKIEIFDPNGKTYTSFYYKPTFENVTVLAKNLDTIYVSSTKEDKIITAYNYKGEELFSFCNIITESTKMAQIFANVVSMTYDNAGYIWVAYRAMPLIRKYSSTGQLVFERKLYSENISKLLVEEKNDPNNKKTSFYYFLHDINYAHNAIYISSNKEMLEIDMNDGGIKKIFKSHNENSDDQKSFSKFSYNIAAGKFVFARDGLLYIITDGI